MKKWPKHGVKMKVGPFAGNTVYMAAQDEIDKYDARLQDMLKDCFGIGGALLTDISSLDDFCPSEDDMAKLRLNYDDTAKITDTLLDVAKRIWG